MLLIFSILRIADDIKIVKEQQFSLCFCTFSDIIINFVSEINIFAIDALNRIKVVLVEQKKTGKWLASVVGGCEALMQNVTHQIASDVTTLVERYEVTLGTTESKVNDFEQEVLRSLKEMGFTL